MELFPEYMEKAAVGLVGEGSECFGFDDQISMDHDYGPSFCVWFPRNIYTEVRESMSEIYDALPKEYKGVSANLIREQSAGRRGILEIEGFYQKFLTRDIVPENLTDWLRIPEHYFAVATNGEVFEDNLGMFSEIREKLLNYYPEDIRLKKIAACASQDGAFRTVQLCTYDVEARCCGSKICSGRIHEKCHISGVSSESCLLSIL